MLHNSPILNSELQPCRHCCAQRAKKLLKPTYASVLVMNGDSDTKITEFLSRLEEHPFPSINSLCTNCMHLTCNLQEKHTMTHLIHMYQLHKFFSKDGVMHIPGMKSKSKETT